MMDELDMQDSSKTSGIYEEPLYSLEQQYHILRYLTNMLQSKQEEINKQLTELQTTIH